jgi:hypothetical protein
VEETTMQYLALLGTDERTAPAPGSDDYNARLGGYYAFAERNGAAIVDAAPLQRSDTATTIRHTDDPPLVTDGPYAESAEAVGGYYVLEAETLDDAIEMARQLPAAAEGWVSIRPAVGWWDYTGGEGSEAADRWLALMYGKEMPDSGPGTEAWAEMAAAHQAFVESQSSAKTIAAGGAVHPLDTATTVRVRDGEVLVTDGPFAESAEVTGGLYVLSAPDRDAAVTLASRIPSQPGGAVEVRPLHVLPAR